MVNEERDGAQSVAERKRILIAQGAAYRVGISKARIAVHTGMTAESLAKSAISHLIVGAYTAIKSGAIFRGGNLQQILLPLVIGGISRLSKKPGLKPIARGALVIGAVAAVVAFIVKKKRGRPTQRQLQKR